jgi:hypothetical protein
MVACIEAPCLTAKSRLAVPWLHHDKSLSTTPGYLRLTRNGRVQKGVIFDAQHDSRVRSSQHFARTYSKVGRSLQKPLSVRFGGVEKVASKYDDDRTWLSSLTNVCYASTYHIPGPSLNWDLRSIFQNETNDGQMANDRSC